MTEFIYIANDDVSLTVEGEHIKLHKPNQRLAPTVPLQGVKQVVIAGGVKLDARSLRRLCSEKMSVILLDSRHPTNSTYCIADGGGNIQRRWQQHGWLALPERHLTTTKLLLRRRLRRQRQLLADAQQERPALRFELTQGQKQLTDRINALYLGEDIEQLRGIEGAAAASFFTAYQHLFAPSLNFCQRERRPPKDPVNAMLSLGYTLLLGECIRLLLESGLDPWLGVLHRPSYNRPSLACDLQEIGRSDIERWVWDLFRKQTLTTAHFTLNDQECRLDKKGSVTFYHEWAELRPEVYRALKRFLYRFMSQPIKEPFEPWSPNWE
ncbi:CRISPR-associated endonuclease Cas1 [Serratia sp. S1B]|nr:CRISPR-associated endonuclease Cas1 [Serratia sp. S1B]